MKKTVVLFIVPIIFALSLHSRCTEVSQEITSELEQEFSDFESALPDYVKDILSDSYINGNYSELLNNLDEKDFLSLAVNYLTAGLETVGKSFCGILLLLIITGILNTFKASILNQSVEFSYSIVSTLAISVFTFQIVAQLTNSTITYIELLSDVMNSFIPVMIGLSIMSGSTAFAVVSSSSMLLFISFIEEFLVKLMLPLVTCSLSFGCVSTLSGSCDFSGIAKTVKTAFTSVTVFTMSIFMFVFSYKTSIAQGNDSLSIKTARFAISSLVPLVGASVNDALKYVTSSLSIIKSSTGIIGIIVIILIMLPIIINLFLNKLSFNLLGSLSRMLGNERSCAILGEADSVCGFLLTLVCCSCVLFILALTVFIKSGVNI